MCHLVGDPAIEVSQMIHIPGSGLKARNAAALKDYG